MTASEGSLLGMNAVWEEERTDQQPLRRLPKSHIAAQQDAGCLYKTHAALDCNITPGKTG